MDTLSEVDGFEGVYRGFRIATRNVEGRLLLEFCVEKNLCMGNSWFKKRIVERFLLMEGVVGQRLTLC